MSEFSKEIQISIEVAAELFTSLIAKAYQGVAGFVKDKNKEHDFFGAATKKYIGGLIGRYNTVQVLGMREPVPLKSLFVRANILEKISARAGLSPIELTEFFDFDRRAFGTRKETVDGERIVNKLKKFIVLGKPGAGKTTYLKYLTLMMLDEFSQIERRKLPIFITLRAWADKPMPLLNFIVEEFDHCGFEQAQPFVERLLKNGDCLVLFDGLDEVSETAKQDDIIRQIKNFADKYTENQFIVSCRVAAYNHWFDGFTEVEMADFNEGQMETFIRNWFHGEPKVATECWEKLKKSPPLRELASVPLLLTLLCLEYGESNNFPPSRAELYERAIETLLKKWDESRLVRRDEVYKLLTTKRKKGMFTHIAFDTFSKNEYFIREPTLAKMIENYVEQLPNFSPVEPEPEGLDILQAIEAHHGIFVEQAKNVHSFAHLTFQEYFTAKYITDNAHEGTLGKLVEQHLYDPKWKEVFLLTVGLLDSADELLLLMRRKANEALTVPVINVLMEAAEKSLLSIKSEYMEVVRRNMAAFIALDLACLRSLELAHTRSRSHSRSRSRSLARALGRVRALDRTLDRIRALDRALDNAPDNDFLDLNHTLALDRALDHAHALALDLASLEAYAKADKLDERIIDKIRNYFSANILIINCLEAANYVSKDVREKMLHEICLPKRG